MTERKEASEKRSSKAVKDVQEAKVGKRKSPRKPNKVAEAQQSEGLTLAASKELAHEIHEEQQAEAGPKIVAEDKENQEPVSGTEEASLPPYKFELAKSSRAKCKKCKEPIEANSPKLAVLMNIKDHPVYGSNHVNCMTKRMKQNIIKKVGNLDDLEGYELLTDAMKEHLDSL